MQYAASRWRFNEGRLRSRADKAVTFPPWWARPSSSWGAEINEYGASSQKQMGLIYLIGLFYWDANFVVLNSLLERSLELSQHKKSQCYPLFLMRACSEVMAGAIYPSLGLAIWYDLANNSLKRRAGFLYFSFQHEEIYRYFNQKKKAHTSILIKGSLYYEDFWAIRVLHTKIFPLFIKCWCLALWLAMSALF